MEGFKGIACLGGGRGVHTFPVKRTQYQQPWQERFTPDCWEGCAVVCGPEQQKAGPSPNSHLKGHSAFQKGILQSPRKHLNCGPSHLREIVKLPSSRFCACFFICFGFLDATQWHALGRLTLGRQVSVSWALCLWCGEADQQAL